MRFDDPKTGRTNMQGCTTCLENSVHLSKCRSIIQRVFEDVIGKDKIKRLVGSGNTELAVNFWKKEPRAIRWIPEPDVVAGVEP
jgi:hypothetical protein